MARLTEEEARDKFQVAHGSEAARVKEALLTLGMPERGPNDYAELNRLVARGVFVKPKSGWVQLAEHGEARTASSEPGVWRCDVHLRVFGEGMTAAEFDQASRIFVETLQPKVFDGDVKILSVDRGALWPSSRGMMTSIGGM